MQHFVRDSSTISWAFSLCDEGLLFSLFVSFCLCFLQTLSPSVSVIVYLCLCAHKGVSEPLTILFYMLSLSYKKTLLPTCAHGMCIYK